MIQVVSVSQRSGVRDLLAYGCRIRLCKGAYKESADVAFEKKEDVDWKLYPVDANGVLPSGVNFHHGIPLNARSDMIAETIRGRRTSNPQGRVRIPDVVWHLERIYSAGSSRTVTAFACIIPYGSDWFPYFMRRLAERPANLGFLLKIIFDRSRCSRGPLLSMKHEGRAHIFPRCQPQLKSAERNSYNFCATVTPSRTESARDRARSKRRPGD